MISTTVLSEMRKSDQSDLILQFTNQILIDIRTSGNVAWDVGGGGVRSSG